MCGGKKTKTHAIMNTYCCGGNFTLSYCHVPLKNVNPIDVSFSEMLTLESITIILQTSIIYYPHNSKRGGVGKEVGLCCISKNY